MKNTLLIAGIFISFGLHAQKFEKIKFNFIDTILPSKPIEDWEGGYQLSLRSNYPENSKQAEMMARSKHNELVANWDNYLVEHKANHEVAVKEYQAETARRKEEYKIQMAEFNKLSGMQKLLQQDNKPKLVLPRKPIYRTPTVPKYRKPNLKNVNFLNHKSKKNSYLKLKGLVQKEPTDQVKIKVFIHDFDITDMVYAPKKLNNTTTTDKVWQRNHRSRVEVTIMVEGEEFYRGMVPKTTEYSSTWSKDQNIVKDVKSIEARNINESLELTNDFINDLIGFTPEKRKIKIKIPITKKRDFTESEQTIEMINSGVDKLKNTLFPEKLDSAIDIWLELLEEADLEDKKSRVNRKVFFALCYGIYDIAKLTKNVEAMETVLTKLSNVKYRTFEMDRTDTMREEFDTLVRKMQANDMM
ncbi:MAG: hypothetical protein N4A45_11220 [Flavobacteriales bacterium]|jgi:hypothetical protein|nr:hypothetical protein [Flavobacteriales bacterium]